MRNITIKRGLIIRSFSFFTCLSVLTPVFADFQCTNIFTSLEFQDSTSISILTEILENQRNFGKDSQVLNIDKMYSSVTQLLLRKKVKFIKNFENGKISQIEIIASPDGAPINKYLYRLEKVFKINTKYFFKIDLNSIGSFSRESREIFFGVESLANLLNIQINGNLSGVIPHELVHAISRRFMFDNSTSELMKIEPNSPFAYSINSNIFAERYAKTIDIAEIEAQIFSAQYALTEIVKELKNGKELSNPHVSFLVNFAKGIKRNLIDIQDNHIQSLHNLFLRSYNIKEVDIIDIENISENNRDFSSEKFIDDIKQQVHFTENTFAPIKIVLVSNRSLKNSIVVILSPLAPVYFTKAPTDLTMQKLIEWVKQHIDERYARLNEGIKFIEKINSVMDKIQKNDFQTLPENLQEVEVILKDLRKFRRAQRVIEKKDSKEIPSTKSVNGVFGIEMDMSMGTATHLGEGVYITAAHNIAGVHDTFNPKNHVFPNISITSFDRNQVLTSNLINPTSHLFFPTGGDIAYSNLKVMKSNPEIADLAFFKATLIKNASHSELGSYTLKKAPFSGGELYTIVTGSNGPRIIPVKYERTENLSEFNRLIVGSTKEFLVPGDSGSPLFEIDPQTGHHEIIGILHGSGTSSGNNYFVETYSALKDMLQSSNLWEQKIRDSNRFQTFNILKKSL